jgi:pyridoxamine 5'-phosphate oxidase
MIPAHDGTRLSQIRHFGHAPAEPGGRAPLDRRDLDPDPLKVFELWLEGALASGAVQPLGMTLATATPRGKPSARIVLLRGIENGGFDFYTNFESRKSADMDANPLGALVWWWPEVGRQARAEGRVARIPDATADAYFRDRPRGSQIAAVVSAQSAVIADREVLLGKWRELEASLAGKLVERPPYWGGYRLTPDTMEFWQEGANRLHDRFRYRRDSPGSPWVLERLAP